MFLILQRCRTSGVATWAATAVLAVLSSPAAAQQRLDNHPVANVGSRLGLEEAIRLSLRSTPSTAVATARREALTAAREAATERRSLSRELRASNRQPL